MKLSHTQLLSVFEIIKGFRTEFTPCCVIIPQKNRIFFLIWYPKLIILYMRHNKIILVLIEIKFQEYITIAIQFQIIFLMTTTIIIANSVFTNKINSNFWTIASIQSQNKRTAFFLYFRSDHCDQDQLSLHHSESQLILFRCNLNNPIEFCQRIDIELTFLSSFLALFSTIKRAWSLTFYIYALHNFGLQRVIQLL